jgi:hypothetical protein
MSKSKSRVSKSGDVKVLVPNADDQLVSIEQAKAEGVDVPAEAVSAEATVETKSRKRGKREINLDDPYMKQTIQVNRLENPKRKGSASAKRFELYRNGMTVAEFLKAGGTRGDLNWDVSHEHIELRAADGLKQID